MRVLKIFFTSMVILFLTALVGSLISREILLSAALSQLKGDMKFLAQSSTGGEFFKQCLEYSGGSFVDEGSMVRNQIRFISDSDYVLESVCKASESVRKVIKNKTLPPLVRRAAGQSGLVQGQSGHGVEVGIFGRAGVVYEEENVLFVASSKINELNVILNEGPATVCSGYGYVCCGDDYQAGQDFYQPNALDCPKSCYASCVEKPVVLTFNSEPTGDDSKVVSLQSGDFIEFIYTISDVKGDVFARENLFETEADQLRWDEKILNILNKYTQQETTADEVAEIIISFGDGTSEKLLDLHGRTGHTYTCERKAICVYNVTIQATTKFGVTSSLDGVAKIQVQVRN